MFFDWSVRVHPPDAMTEKYPASMFCNSFAVNIFELLPAVFVIVYITLSGKKINPNLYHRQHNLMRMKLGNVTRKL